MVQWKGVLFQVHLHKPPTGATKARCAEEGGYTMEQAYLRKLAKFAVRCKAEVLAFLPLASDMFWGWHPVALATITKLGRQLARNVG